MTTGLWLIVALGLLLVFAVTDRTLQVRYRWLRWRLFKARTHRLESAYNPHREAWRTFTRTGVGPAGQGVGREDLATAGSSLRRPIQFRKERGRV